MGQYTARSESGGVSDLPTAARIVRESLKDKTYRAYPMGGEAGAYLRWKRGRLTPESYRSYEACLDKLARLFPDLEITSFEPPVGTQRLEEFMDDEWGRAAPRTFNKNLSVVKDFFKWAVLSGRLHGDPALPLVPHKKREVHREIFRDDARTAILADGPEPGHLFRDRVALRLLLKYGLRKGALRATQFKHFDHHRRRLTVFTKGGKVRELPLVDQALWNDLERLILDIGAEPQDYLLCRQKSIWRGYEPDGSSRFERKAYSEKPMGVHGMHDWWYGCLRRAGLVQEGVTSGERMHKARHTAGQRILDATGNLKAAQKLLMHESIQTTADTYTDWDIDQLAETLRGIED